MIVRKDLKQVLADSLEDLMRKKPLGKISIGEIALNCGTTRQTFYNNFQDKYELIIWIFQKDKEKYIRSHESNHTWQDHVFDTCKLVLEKKQFYINALNDGQNSLWDYFYTCAMADSIDLFKKQHHNTLLKDELIFALKFHFHGAVEMSKEWIGDGMRLSPEHMTLRSMNCIPEIIKQNMILS